VQLDSKLNDWTVKHKGLEAERRKAFGLDVRTYRLQNDISMDEFARRAHISGETLLRIEAGRVSPDIKSINKRIERAKQVRIMVIA
jgi:DNA-binding XRE family transcriptional regulator